MRSAQSREIRLTRAPTGHPEVSFPSTPIAHWFPLSITSTPSSTKGLLKVSRRRLCVALRSYRYARSLPPVGGRTPGRVLGPLLFTQLLSLAHPCIRTRNVHR